MSLDEVLAPHGVRRRYRQGCRCPDCRKAAARYQNERLADAAAGRPRTLDNIGVRRRVHALRALGWPTREIARCIGVDERNICRWEHRQWITRGLYERVCAVYDELSMTPGPDTRARLHAQRRGWLPPLAYDDDTIDDPNAHPAPRRAVGFAEKPTEPDRVLVERTLAGERLKLTAADKREVARKVLARGGSTYDVGQVLRLNTVSARRLVAELTEAKAS